MSKQIIFTCTSLDGAGCCLSYKWLTNIIVPHVILAQGNLRKELTAWLAKNKLSNYDRVNFFGLDTSDCKDLIDESNVLIIDHHKDHAKNYLNAKTIISLKSNTSTDIIYRNLLSRIKELTIPQKLLIALIEKAYEQPPSVVQSKNLRTLFSLYNGDRIEKFCIDFHKGFETFTDRQQNLLNFHYKSLENKYKELELYSGEVQLKDKKVSILSTIADSSQYDLAEFLCEKHKCDVVTIISPSTNKVLFKRNFSDIHVGNFAKTIANGNGSEYTATGALTDEFLALTKCLAPL